MRTGAKMMKEDGKITIQLKAASIAIKIAFYNGDLRAVWHSPRSA